MAIKYGLPSICIPRLFLDITNADIITVFENILGKGSVSRVDLIRKQQGMDSYQRAFVHFSNKCVNNKQYNVIKDRLCQDLDIKIVYSEHWFWKCSVSRSQYQQKW